MENIVGEALDYLRAKGVDVSTLTIDEIIEMYNNLKAQEEADKVSNEQSAEEVTGEENVPAEESISDIDTLLSDNAEIINSLNEEQKALFDKIIAMI